ncbi:MAG: phosphatase PAP2 family protein [Streptococcaceae bacterium]|jgi:undecaprenyl-diphosphatase|nr:phosphatase PAP2 family protein [Streptococcaceae bacterium]
MHKKFHYSLASLCLILFAVLAVIVRLKFQNSPMNIVINDTAIQKAVISLRTATLTPIMKDITWIFGPGGGLFLAGIIAILILIFKKKNRWQATIYFGIMIVIAAGLNPVIKKIVNRTRPALVQLVTETDKSFPSGHSVFATMLMGALFLILVAHMKNLPAKILLGILASIIILSVMFSRIYLAVHYPSDTIAGMLLGLAILHFTYPTYYKLVHGKQGSHQRG